MTKRLNDTKAVAAMVPYESQSQHYSRTVRPIDNGFIVSEHSYGPNDPSGPTSKEYFSKDHPDKLESSDTFGSGSAMKKAVDFMTRK